MGQQPPNTYVATRWIREVSSVLANPVREEALPESVNGPEVEYSIVIIGTELPVI